MRLLNFRYDGLGVEKSLDALRAALAAEAAGLRTAERQRLVHWCSPRLLLGLHPLIPGGIQARTIQCYRSMVYFTAHTIPYISYYTIHCIPGGSSQSR